MEATCFFSLHHHKLSNLDSLVDLAENVIMPPSFAYCNRLSFQTTGNCTIRACVHGTGSSSARKSVPDKALQDGELLIHKSSQSKIANRDKLNQGRLIALFRRIQNLISEGESGNVNDTRFQLSTDDSSLQGSVKEFLHQSNSEQVKSKQSERSTRKTRIPKKEKSIPDSQHSANNKLTRLPSNFTRKSPIPSPTPLRSYEHNVDKAEGHSSEAHSDPEKLDEMKLSELKGLAKERGMKGYSKLKKIELVELLRSQDSSSSLLELARRF